MLDSTVGEPVTEMPVVTNLPDAYVLSKLPDAYVNCPMPALIVQAFTAYERNLYLLPDGCNVGSTADGRAVSPPTLSEGCKAAFCEMCYPNFPEGAELTGHAPSVWAGVKLTCFTGTKGHILTQKLEAATNFSLSNHSYRALDRLSVFYVAGGLRPHHALVA